jgi:uncharacterized membrane protein/mono/diheme cytochrome c family protein
MKKWWLSAALSLTMFGGIRPGIAKAQADQPVRDIGAEVHGVFAAKCSGCHGADLAKPKGRFGYVLDLRRVAENPEMVIPLRPTESELWVLVQRDEMPPNDSPHGPLSTEQKEVIRAWITVGAPDANPAAQDANPPVRSEAEASVPLELALGERLIRWLGKFHLVLLHFPIALVVAGGAAEAWSVWQRKSTPSESVRFCLWLAALASIPTVGFGWLFAAAGNGMSSPQLLLAHRWLGTIAAVWLLVTAVCAESDARRGARSRGVWLLLASGVLIVALTAHLGGLLANGVDFFGY